MIDWWNVTGHVKRLMLTLNHADPIFNFPVLYICPQSKASQHSQKVIYQCLSRMLTVFAWEDLKWGFKVN